ncbi:CUB and sushi domain-containing protein, partial [Mytilus galloprovincialis]
CTHPIPLNETSISIIENSGTYKATYNCNGGSNLIGNGVITCQDNLTWTDPLFFCSECSNPPVIPHGNLHIDLIQTDQLVYYDCNDGYNFYGEKYIKCENDDTWTNPKFICTPCIEPPSVQNASYKIENINSNYEVLYECDVGLLLIGNKFINCLSNGTWTYPTLLCTECPAAPSVQNAAVNVDLIRDDDSKLTYQCLPSYYMYGSNVIDCNINSTWTPTVFACIECVNPGNVTNAVFTFVMENGHMIFYYECQDELYLIGNNTQQCQSNSEWTRQKFTCSTCPQPEQISQTSVIVEVSPYDRIVKYQCENGTIGAGNITCQSDLTWTAPYFTCSGCTDPPETPDANYEVVHGDRNVVYECDVGLNLIGNKNIECQPGGNWTDRSFICTVCAEPADVMGAMYTVEKFNSNYTVFYKCDDEFNLLGNGVMECQSDSNWPDHNFICTKCSQPPAVQNASFKVVPSDNNVVYECDSELNLIGNENIECKSDGNWTYPSFICIACVEPPVVKNGTYTFEMIDNNHVARYRCDGGFTLIGNDVIECQLNGSWTDINLKCTDCPNPPNIMNAAVNTENIHHDDVTLTYMCNDACTYPPHIQNTTIEVEVIAGDPVVKYSCISGLTQIGFGYTACDNNKWTLPTFICSDCGPPPSRLNATVFVDNTQNDILINYHCDDGFNVTGLPTLQCEMGTWLIGNFTCVSV